MSGALIADLRANRHRRRWPGVGAFLLEASLSRLGNHMIRKLMFGAVLAVGLGCLMVSGFAPVAVASTVKNLLGMELNRDELLHIAKREVALCEVSLATTLANLATNKSQLGEIERVRDEMEEQAAVWARRSDAAMTAIGRSPATSEMVVLATYERPKKQVQSDAKLFSAMAARRARVVDVLTKAVPAVQSSLAEAEEAVVQAKSDLDGARVDLACAVVLQDVKNLTVKLSSLRDRLSKLSGRTKQGANGLLGQLGLTDEIDALRAYDAATAAR